MNKTEIVHRIHKELGKEVTMKTIDLVVDKFMDVMVEALAKGEDVQLGDFGTFSLSKYAVKTAENFVTSKRN
jgi:nucleoid DNA-binding protein